MSIDYTKSIENLFESINVIVSKKLEDVSFDTTIVCTVVDDSDRKNGKYQVTNGTAKFDAYTDSSDYRTGDSVRVQVLNGDYSAKKYIVGKAVTSTDNTPLTYVSPIDTIVNITGNLVDDKGSKCGLTANGTETEISLWGADLSEHEIWTDGIYSALSIRADFRTLLDNYDLKAGSYGLRVHLYIKPSKDSTYYVDNYFELDSSEMFGNPYAFSVYTKQGKKVTLTTSGIVQYIVLSAYQKANFVNRSGNAIGAAKKENIFIKNIEIGFGSDLEKIDDNTVKIYTNSSTQYRYYQHTPETNTKTLGLLWYNKNDNNEYLGFSDGYYDPEYDEIEYLKASAEDARLAAYMARDNMPSDTESLDLAANIDEAIPIFQAARKLVTADLITQLHSFENQLNADAASLLKDYIKTSSDNILTAAASDIQKNEESLKKMYSDILAYWYEKSNGKTPADVEGVKDYATLILNAFGKINTTITELLTSIRKEALSGYLGVCDNYEARINRVLNSIQDKLDTLPSGILDGTDYSRLKKWKTKDSFKSYQRKDFSSYDNKYCIYWYHANKDAEADEVMSDGWERIETLDNFGIPTEAGEKIEGKVHNQVKLPAGENTAEYEMQYDLEKETFKAVVFYNHDKFISNELEFTNADDVPDKALLDKSDALVIRHVTNSRDNYNCYAMTNYLLNAADSSVEREIECYYDGLLAKNEVLVNARAYWYVPEDSTMITVNKNLLTANDFVVDKSRPKDGYTCYYKLLAADVTENEDGTKSYDFGESLSFWYRIKPYYEQSAALNDIQCEVILANENDEDYIAGQLTLTFGQQSTSGTKYTMVIAPSTIQRGTTASDNYLMSLHLEDAEGELVPLSTASLPTEASETAYGLEITPVMSRVADGTDKEKGAPSLSNEGNAVEAERWTLTANAKNYGIYKASASIGIVTTKDDDDTKTRYVDLIAWFNVPWSAGQNGNAEKPGYYLSGPTSIIYNNLGTLDSTAAYQTPYKLFSDDNKQVEVTWSIEPCKIDGATATDEDIDLRYMPKLNTDNTLSPAPMYLNGLEYYPVLVAKQGNNVLWRQPIIIMQNQYASNMLNDWDGSFQIDKENGTIMSTMIAAGRKNTNNTFEGVVMGCVAQELEIDELNDSADGVGLYGFHDGAASFGILADGTAFMGKAGNGRILINGNKGTIESAAYSQTYKPTTNENGEKEYNIPAGMQVDLENGKLVMRSASLGTDENAKWVAAGVGENDNADGNELSSVETRYAATITMDSNVNNDSYLDITVPWWNDDNSKWVLKPLIHIGDTIKDSKIKHSYYLQSQNYKEGTYSWENGAAHSKDGAGTLFNLVEGYIDAYNFKLQSKNVLIDSSETADPYFVVKSDADLKDSADNSIGNRNLIYCGKGLYYLQSGDYSENVAGTKIDLTLGKISSYNFELSAGTANTGLIEIKSAPEDEGYFLNVQKGDNAYIRLSKDGVLSLKASTFTLTAGNTYFSSSAATYTINGSERSVVLRMGDNFGVSADGKLYCADAVISGSITATTLSASDGTIGGWTITSSTLEKNGVKLSSADGTIAGATISGGELNIGEGTCQIDKDGILTATGAVLTTLTVNKSLAVAADNAEGTLLVDGTSTIKGDLVVYGKGSSSPVCKVTTTATAADGTGSGLWVGASFVILNASTRSYIGLDSNHICHVNGKLYAQGDFYYTGSIYCRDNNETDRKGVNGSIYYTSGGFWGGPVKEAKFINGILIDAEVSSGGDDNGSSSGTVLPALTDNAGAFLQVNNSANGTQWTKLYAPTSIPVKGKVWGGTGTTQDPPDWVTMAQVLGVGSSQNGQFLQAYSEAGTTDVRWKKLYAPISAGQSGQVWGTDGTTPAWKTIGATLVNFTNGTATITKKTSGSTTYYVVSKTISTAVKSDAKTGYISNYYLCWNDSSATSQKVTTYETTSSYTASQYDHYTMLSQKARAYTYYDITTSSTTVSSEVQIDISLT